MIPTTAVQLVPENIFTPEGVKPFDYINFLAGQYNFENGTLLTAYSICKNNMDIIEPNLIPLYNNQILVPKNIVETWNVDDEIYDWVINELGLTKATI